MQTDVLIVGGGLSGLALADHLARAGVDFLLVEAQNRLGGRILTKNLSGGAFDLGPAWFWPGQPRMARMAERLSLTVFEQYSTGELVFQDQRGSVQRGRGYASMQGSYRLGGGMGALIDGLACTINSDHIWIGASVTALTLEQDSIRAMLSDDNEVTAKRIVLAIPPRVAAETLAFDPALSPQQMETMQSTPTWMAGQAKIIATYDKPHWRDAGLSGDAMSHRGPMIEVHDASPQHGGPYALFGFVGVPAEQRAAHKDKVLDLALAQLVDLFGPKMSDPSDLILQDWATVPEIARERDFAPFRSHPAYGLEPELQGLWDGKLHLASTETSQGFGGFLEGALEAVDRTAKALLLDVSNAA